MKKIVRSITYTRMPGGVMSTKITRTECSKTTYLHVCTLLHTAVQQTIARRTNATPTSTLSYAAAGADCCMQQRQQKKKLWGRPTAYRWRLDIRVGAADRPPVEHVRVPSPDLLGHRRQHPRLRHPCPRPRPRHQAEIDGRREAIDKKQQAAGNKQ